MDRRGEWLRKAEALKPVLNRETVRPVSGMPESPLREGDEIVLDFGNHFVGKLTLKLGFAGSHPDAPVWLRLKFCENERELGESVDDYHGWISKGWIQSEQVHVDVLPCELTLPRRYAFRYVKLEVLAVSSKFNLVIEDAFAETTTSAGVCVPVHRTGLDAQIERVALRTLRSCMQEVFEDGPKRDRRLWLGDLRLQALANYATYQNNDLVKRCLYLFAGTVGDDGRIAACVFTEPKTEADDTFMFDYSLFFIPTLLDYLTHTDDRETAKELLPIALRQLENAEEAFDPEWQIVKDCDRLGWCFIDWNLNLNKQAPAHAVWLYAAKAACELMERLEVTDGLAQLQTRIARRTEAALAHFYDADKGLFVSGNAHQVSWASQVWFALAGVLPNEQAYRCLQQVAACPEAEKMVTPYMMHHYVDALHRLGHQEEALTVLRGYWGGMVDKGADTFWELFNPENPDESPYGSSIVNSYCHAWSCTPVCFLRG